MRVAVLFDGAGLARLGLEQAGLECVGYELDPVAHHLSTMVGSGNCVLADVRDVDLSGFAAVWASPPCQAHSYARNDNTGAPLGPLSAASLLTWSMGLPHRVLWVENVAGARRACPPRAWLWNAAQFTDAATQNRVRLVWGRYPIPRVYRAFRFWYDGAQPTVTASEGKCGPGCVKRGGVNHCRHAGRLLGHPLSPAEAAALQGFEIPAGWCAPLPGFTPGRWRVELYRAIGNGVPVWMSRAFGEAAARLEAAE